MSIKSSNQVKRFWNLYGVKKMLIEHSVKMSCIYGQCFRVTPKTKIEFSVPFENYWESILSFDPSLFKVPTNPNLLYHVPYSMIEMIGAI